MQKFKMLSALLLLLTAEMVVAIEEPAYTLLYQQDGIEYREYDNYLVATTEVMNTADRNDAANEGFLRLFKYISGENAEQTKIAMTSPVQQSQKQKIAMTAPVQQTPTPDGWTIAFVVPAEFTSNTVPVPNNPQIYIEEKPARLVAVLRYSGRWTDKNLASHREELLAKLKIANVEPLGEVISAVYNAPFIPPFLRRNEVMVTVDRIPSK
jgi:hypothetical protein